MSNIIIVLSLLLLGYFFGRHAESRHYKSIEKREAEYIKLPVTNSRHPLMPLEGNHYQAKLVTGNVVISVDYFKRMLAGLRGFFGGNVQSYETLVDRARREAVLRLKEQCLDAEQVINLRIETSSISQGQGDQIGSIEVLAYATAIYHTA